MFPKRVASLCLLLMSLLLTVPAHAAKEIGTTISLTPAVQAEREGKLVDLQIKSPIFLGDALRSDTVGKAQILLIDDTTISLAPSTRISMDEFFYGEDNNSFAMQITSGLARVVTGKIVKANAEGFKVVTPLASIGIRGTDVTIMVDGAKTTVISNAIHQRDIQITNRATGEISSIAKSGVAVEATGAGNVQRPATPEERVKATQAARRAPATQLTAQNSETANSTGGSGGSDNNNSAQNDGESQGKPSTSSTYMAAASAGSSAGSDTGSNTSSGVNSGASTAQMPVTSEPNLDLKGDIAVPPATPAPDPVPDPAPPTPDPVPPVPDPVPPTPDPVPPTPDPVPPVPDPVPPLPDPVPPVPDPEAPVPPAPLPPTPVPNPLGVSGGFSGNLAGTARSTPVSGTFQMEVALNSGEISKGSMSLTDASGAPLFAAYKGTGSMNSNSFRMANWGTMLGTNAEINGTFTDATTLSSLNWSAAKDNTTRWTGTGNSITHSPGGVTELLPNDKGVSGYFSGTLTDTVNNGNNSFGFAVDTASGRISMAHMIILNASQNFLFDAYDGKGLVQGLRFSVSEWDTPVSGKNGYLSGVFGDASNITSVNWSAATNDDTLLSGNGTSFMHTTLIEPYSPNPKKISGGFSGELLNTGTDKSMTRGDFQFNVDLKSGIVSGASMRGFNADGTQLFGAYGGTARIRAAATSGIHQWTRFFGSDAFTLTPVRFDEDGKLTSVVWGTGTAAQWSGDDSSSIFTPQPNPLTPLDAPTSGRFSGALAGTGVTSGSFDFNVNLASGSITDAALSGVHTAGAFSAIGGSGSITGNAFAINNFKGDATSHMSGTKDPAAIAMKDTFTGITWGSAVAAAPNTPVSGTGTVTGFDPVMANKGPEHIQGSFSGTSGHNSPYTGSAEISFDVALGTGQLSNSKLIINDGSTTVFTGIGGTGGKIDAASYNFAVSQLQEAGKSDLGSFSGNFNSASSGKIAEWTVTGTSGTVSYQGSNMHFTKQ